MQKKLAVDRINSAISRLMVEHEISVQTQVFENSDSIRKLASLMSAKQEINATSEWPIDLPQGAKGILLAISIPLSWAAGSIVETLISDLNLF